MKFLTKYRLEDWGWLALVISPTAVLYFNNIGKWSIWHDESFTAMLINYDWGEVLRRTALDVHPPLYYLVLKVWTELFGTSLVAMRSLSVLCMLGVIIAAYWLMKSLFGRGAARLATVFLALAPYGLRYSQEGRMYALVALLLVLATYVLVTAIKKQSRWLIYLYPLVMALAIYCHYYAIFLLPAHWLYVLLVTRGKDRPKGALDLKSPHWWGANITILLLLAPWLLTAFDQFTSIQGAFWILPVGPTTMLSTIASFLFYKEYLELDSLQKIWLLGLSAGLAGLLGAAIYFNKFHRRALVLIALYALLAPVIIFILSLPPFQPIYNNRYFSLTAVAFYMLLAALVYLRPLNKWRVSQIAAVTVIVVSLAYGITNVRTVGNYNPDRNESYTMNELSQTINQRYQEGDTIVSSNLSTYFDIRYYNRTSAAVLLYAPEPMTGRGNTALVYDRTDILLTDYAQVKSATGRVWVVTDSWDMPPVPAGWQRLERTNAGYAAVELYTIKAGRQQPVCAQVMTTARNLVSGETREFTTSCLPEGWVPAGP